jgi:hypothetical protein
VLNLQIAKAYLAGTDKGIATRTWQLAIVALTNTKQSANQHRWRTAAKDKAFAPLAADANEPKRLVTRSVSHKRL